MSNAADMPLNGRFASRDWKTVGDLARGSGTDVRDSSRSDESPVFPQCEIAKAAVARRWRWFGAMLCLVLVSRFLSEIVNTLLWDRANYVWSSCAAVAIVLVLWPLLLMLKRGQGNIFIEYGPIFAYMAILFARAQFDSVYSWKCVFSELILWSCFLFTAQVSSQSAEAAETIQTWLLRVVKAVVLVGVAQLLVFIIGNGTLDPRAVLEARPVQGVFVHPNLFLVVVLPFLFYFLKRRSWLWAALTAATCLGTGTRSPLLAALCLSLPIVLSFFNRRIGWKHIIVSLLVIVCAYGLLLRNNAEDWDYSEETRANMSTFQWRIAFWRQILERDHEKPAFWLGHGVGAADRVSAEAWGEDSLPHNDYLRSYYDLGFIGLLAAAAVVVFMLRWLMRSATTGTDFIIIAYLLIACFRFTDNFMYVTITLWIYMFLGSHARPANQ
jgi:O-antigen ligase